MKLFTTILRWIFFIPLGILSYTVGQSLFLMFCSLWSLDIVFIPNSDDKCVSWIVNTNKVIGLPLVYVAETFSVVLGLSVFFWVLPKFKKQVLYILISLGLLGIIALTVLNYLHPRIDCDYSVYMTERLGHVTGQVISFLIIFRALKQPDNEQ